MHAYSHACSHEIEIHAILHLFMGSHIAYQSLVLAACFMTAVVSDL